MGLFKKTCLLCQEPHLRWQPYCHDCKRLFAEVKKHMGQVGLSQLMDELIATGIPKPRILNFLTADPYQKGSLMDQILAQLSNNLAEGIGVKGDAMTPEDVKRIRDNPTFGASNKPLEK